MKFSVIVPVYNAENYLHKLVESVLQQTYKDYELILVDDGSTDGSYALMKQYAKRYNQIKAYTKENTGPGMTRKFGFEKATGDLLFFVDSDDWITAATSLEEICSIFIEQPQIDILFFDREDIVGNEKSIIPGFRNTAKGLYPIEQLNEDIRPGLGAKIFKRELMSKDMFFESDVFEDLYTSFAYLEKCSFFYYQPASFYTIYHDKVSNSLSSNEDSGMFLRSLKMILKIYEGTPKKSLRYSLELKMATLYTSYWRYKIKRKTNYASREIKKEVRKIVSILNEEQVMIKPKNKVVLKCAIYKFLLILGACDIL